MINWVNNKNINLEIINQKINNCLQTKHFTNNGKNVLELKKKFHDLFELDDTKSVLLVCNGTMGLNALISGLNIHYNKKLIWVVQAFTFPSSCQCQLMDSIILDIDDNMGPDINKLKEIKNDYDGVIITNCFGCSTNIKLYEEFCRDNDKMLLFDNAAASYSIYENTNHLNFGNGSMISLHHTKPIGFGEGGFIVFDNQYLESMEKAICFGFTSDNKLLFNQNASNYKMSEINAIYIDNFLSNNFNYIYENHKKLIKYFILKMKDNNLENKIKLFKSYSDYNESLLSCIPILFNNKIDIDIFINNNIEAKKYYYPLDQSCKISVDLFDRIICLPLNTDINEEIIDKYICIILQLF